MSKVYIYISNEQNQKLVAARVFCQEGPTVSIFKRLIKFVIL